MAKVKTCVKNILETGIVTVAEGVENTDFPKWRLWDRNVEDLSKWTGERIKLKIDQGTDSSLWETIDQFLIKGADLIPGARIIIKHSDDDITYAPNADDAGYAGEDIYEIDVTEQTKRFWTIEIRNILTELAYASAWINPGSIAVDSEGIVHLAWFDDFTANLYYANNITGAFVRTTVDNASGVQGTYNSICLDSNGFVHIFYRDNALGLMHSDNTTGIWRKETIDAGINLGLFTSCAIESNNTIHIAYRGMTGPDNTLKYAYGSYGSWTVETADNVAGKNLGSYSRIALDSNNKPHIAHHNLTDGDLRYARKTTGAWQIEDVATTNNVGAWPGLGLESDDTVHISYHDNTNGTLRHAYGLYGSWTDELVYSDIDVGEHTDLVVDADDDVHISFHDNTSGSLMYINNKGKATGYWNDAFTIDDSGGANMGEETRMVISPYDSSIHIAYINMTDLDIYHARIGGSMQLTEMFLTSLYEFERNPSRPCDKDKRFNVERFQESGGHPRYIKHGQPRAYRLYSLPRMTAAQSTNIQALNDAWDGCKPFFLCDHNGVWLFGELLSPIGLAEESSNRDSCTLEFQEIPS